MKDLKTIAIVLAALQAGCGSIIVAAAVSGSEQGAKGKVSKFEREQRGQAYLNNKSLLDKLEAAEACYKPFVTTWRAKNDQMLNSSLAEMNKFSDELDRKAGELSVQRDCPRELVRDNPYAETE